jgi:Fe-S-cluster-containing dehydrogenase component
MPVSRRDLFRMAGMAPVSALAAIHEGDASIQENHIPPGAVGLLFDATKCIGCKACVSACASANGLEPDTSLDGLHQTPLELNAFTKNIIKLCKPTPEHPESFVKQQCMHCGDPACVAACPFDALAKNSFSGIVEWAEDKCIGCRYCEIACPFHVPKFEWSKFNPKIVKCELCNFRLAANQEPACTYVCPTHAVVFGKRGKLLDVAKQRIVASPDKYFENRVYGEKEAGGTQCLIISAIPFTDMGLPTIDQISVPAKALFWQKKIYKWMAGPLLLYAGIAAAMKRNWTEHEKEMVEEEKETGLKRQI